MIFWSQPNTKKACRPRRVPKMAVSVSPGVAIVVLWIGGFPHDFCGPLHIRLFHHVVGT